MRRTTTILSTSLVAAILAASFFLRRELWGLAAWGAVSPYVALALAAIIVPQFFRASVPDPFGRIPSVRPRALRLLLVTAVSVVCMQLLVAKHDLWGERITLASAIEHGKWLPAGPLSTFVRSIIYRFMHETFLWNAPETISLCAVVFGTLFVFAAMRSAAAVFADESERGIRHLATAVLLANGYVAVFLAGGNAAVAALLVLVFLVYTLSVFRSERSLVIPAALFGAAVLSHVSAVFLTPAFAYCAVVAIRRPSTRMRSLAAVAVPVCAWIVFELAGAARGTATPARFAWNYAASELAGLSHGGHRTAAPAALDGLNALFMIGPLSLAAIAFLVAEIRRPAAGAGRGGGAGEGRFLTLAAVGALLLVAGAAAGIDGGLRRHIVASAGPSLSLYALWSLRRHALSLDAARSVAAMLFLVGAFHAVPLVVVGEVLRFAERRVLSLPLTPGRAEMIIAEQAEDDGNRAKAKLWYAESLAKNPANALVERRLGAIAMREEEYPAAITHYLNAHELEPSSPRPRFELAEALIGNRWFPEAIPHLETLTVAYPESVAFWRRLGFARNNSNRFADAVFAYEKALAIEPGNDENVRNLVSALLNRAAELQVARRTGEARALYERAISLYPDDWRAFNNLAVMEMDEGRYREAEKMLGDALERHAYEPTLHTNMGLVLEKLGRDSLALEHLRMSADLDPLYSKAPYHIERIEKRLGIVRPPAE